MYNCHVEVTVSALRAELASWLARVRAGEEVVITERGTPIVRLLSVESAPLIEDLTTKGVLSKPARTQRTSARRSNRVRARGSVADLVSDQRG